MSTNPAILDEILKQLKREKKQSWPVHIVGQASMIVAPAGNVLKKATLVKYGMLRSEEEKDQFIRDMRKDAIITVCNSIRFIEALENFKK